MKKLTPMQIHRTKVKKIAKTVKTVNEPMKANHNQHKNWKDNN